MLRKTFVSLFAVLALATYANAGPVYLKLVLDPSTTAGSGVAPISRAPATGNWTVTSNRNLAGSFHLYALSDVTNTTGISAFSVALGGAGVSYSNVFNRSPLSSFNNTDENGDTVQSGIVGFDQIRSGSGVNPALPIQGGQDAASLHKIAGMGSGPPNNFNNTPGLNPPPDGGARSWGASTSGQWGIYGTDPTETVAGRTWLFLGEGNYAGGTPTIDHANSWVQVFVDPTGTNPFGAQRRAGGANVSGVNETLVDGVPGPAGTPPSITDLIITNKHAVNDSPITGNITATGSTPITWSGFTFLDFVASHGGDPVYAAGQASNATLASNGPNSAGFSWDSIGAPRGTYRWTVDAQNGFGTDNDGIISVQITGVPEPATFALVGLALVGLVGVTRRR